MSAMHPDDPDPQPLWSDAIAKFERLLELPAGERDAFLAGYRKAMDELVTLIDQLGKSITDGDWEGANKIMGLIKQSQREGHKEYRSEKD